MNEKYTCLYEENDYSIFTFTDNGSLVISVSEEDIRSEITLEQDVAMKLMKDLQLYFKEEK